MELLKIDSHLPELFRNQFKLLIKYHENTLQKNFIGVVLAIQSLSSCSEDFLVKTYGICRLRIALLQLKTYIFIKTERLHRSLYIRYETKLGLQDDDATSRYC
jgi:hypothetical protein